MFVAYHHFVSLYSFMMGFMWFNVLILVGLALRKLRYPLKFSPLPLFLLLVLSVLRMFIAIEIPSSIIILSETVYPAIVNFLRFEIVEYTVFGLPINVSMLVVTVWGIGTVGLTAKYVDAYIGKYRPLMKWLGSTGRDNRAETLLSEIIGTDKHFHVYRNGAFESAFSTAFKPYIILPEIEWSEDELRVILLHEWKHIQDKDYLTEIIVNLICFVFWWNPLVYVLRRNFRFAQELKADKFSISDSNDFRHLLKGHLLVQKPNIAKGLIESGVVNAFVGFEDNLPDRLKVLALKGVSSKKRFITNVCYSLAIICVFFASYTVTVLPAFWIPADVSITEDFPWEHSEGTEIFRAEENYLLDNGDGTFSLYIDGQFVMYVDESSEMLMFIPVLPREDS